MPELRRTKNVIFLKYGHILCIITKVIAQYTIVCTRLSIIVGNTGASSSDLRQLDTLLNVSLKDENDEQTLFCHICQLPFVSLNNKHSHFSGRHHRQALMDQLHHTIAATNEDTSCRSDPQQSCWKSKGHQNQDISDQLQAVGAQCKGMLYTISCAHVQLSNA